MAKNKGMGMLPLVLVGGLALRAWSKSKGVAAAERAGIEPYAAQPGETLIGGPYMPEAGEITAPQVQIALAIAPNAEIVKSDAIVKITGLTEQQALTISQTTGGMPVSIFGEMTEVWLSPPVFIEMPEAARYGGYGTEGAFGRGLSLTEAKLQASQTGKRVVWSFYTGYQVI